MRSLALCSLLLFGCGATIADASPCDPDSAEANGAAAGMGGTGAASAPVPPSPLPVSCLNLTTPEAWMYFGDTFTGAYVTCLGSPCSLAPPGGFPAEAQRLQLSLGGIGGDEQDATLLLELGQSPAVTFVGRTTLAISRIDRERSLRFQEVEGKLAATRLVEVGGTRCVDVPANRFFGQGPPF